MPSFNINTNEVVLHTARLERLGRNALPIAIRNTLNKAAFDVKTNTMPESAKGAFVQRSPNFFKANSKVEPATGLDVNSMKATVGFVPKSGTDTSVDDLEQQEDGGAIEGRAMIALKQARSGGSWNKRVRAAARISQARGKVINPADARRASGPNQAFIMSAVHAGKGGLVRGTGSNRDIVFQVRSLKRIRGNTIVKVVPMYSLKRGRRVNPKATHFMRVASLKSAEQLERNYIKEAKRQIEKLR